MDWLISIDQTIASALGGSLAGLAVDTVSKAIGIGIQRYRLSHLKQVITLIKKIKKYPLRTIIWAYEIN